MSEIRPFRGLRPRPDLAREVASPPYDVLSASEARAMAADNPNSFLRVNKAELEFPEGADPHADEVYARAKANLERLESSGVMKRDSTPCLYVYRLTMSGRSQTGLVTLTSVDEYDRGLIKKHEHTRPNKVADRAQHILTLDAQVGPVFSTFRTTEAIRSAFSAITTQPAPCDFTADGVRHELWVVDGTDRIDAFVTGFAALDCLYIADGHHRSEAASVVAARSRDAGRPGGAHQSFLNVLFPHDELRILPYNRVVRDTAGKSVAGILEEASGRFEVTETVRAVSPDTLHDFGLYAAGRWYHLRARPGTFDASHPTKSIDAAVLADGFLEPILGIIDPRTDERIDFIGGIRGTKALERAVDSGEYALAFSLHPTSIEQLLGVADAGEVMPPKSTWFEPKLRSGMVVNRLSD